MPASYEKTLKRARKVLKARNLHALRRGLASRWPAVFGHSVPRLAVRHHHLLEPGNDLLAGALWVAAVGVARGFARVHERQVAVRDVF